MKEIHITKGQKTIVDDEVYEYLSQWKWLCHKGYARRCRRLDDDITKYQSSMIHMSREVWRLIGRVLPKGYILDHINGDKLDNRLCNLRACTQNENIWNTRPYRVSSSGYRGVYNMGFIHPDRPFLAKISFKGKRKDIGSFKTAEEAAKAYNKKAKELHGEFAILNDV